MRISFCGVIEGSVTLRPGETKTDAILRAERSIQAVLDRNAKSFARTDEGLTRETGGPVVGLEDADPMAGRTQ